MLRANAKNVEYLPGQNEGEPRTIMTGCLGTRSRLHNNLRMNLLNILNPYPFILLLRRGYAPPSPPAPFTSHGHLRRDVELELESSLHHAPTVPPTVFKYGEGGSLSSSSLDERLPAEE